jgi:ABC-type multidrug transport system fused ATPase/permease subunit
VLIADFGLGEALLTVLSVFFVVIWIWILITILTDLFRDHEVSGPAKAAWVFFLVFVPFVTALVYLIVRGRGMRDRALRAQADARSQFEGYVRDTAAGAPVEELHRLHELKQKGALTEDEYAKLKARLVDADG